MLWAQSNLPLEGTAQPFPLGIFCGCSSAVAAAKFVPVHVLISQVHMTHTCSCFLGLPMNKFVEAENMTEEECSKKTAIKHVPMTDIGPQFGVDTRKPFLQMRADSQVISPFECRFRNGRTQTFRWQKLANQFEFITIQEKQLPTSLSFCNSFTRKSKNNYFATFPVKQLFYQRCIDNCQMLNGARPACISEIIHSKRGNACEFTDNLVHSSGAPLSP